MNTNREEIDLSPFPDLSWDGLSWHGMIDLRVGSAGLNVMVNNPDRSLQPSQQQAEALKYLYDHDQRVIATAFESIRTECAPPEDEPLASMIDLMQIYFHTHSHEDLAYVGLLFNCEWEPEHGLGLVFHKDRLVALGAADLAFTWDPDDEPIEDEWDLI